MGIICIDMKGNKNEDKFESFGKRRVWEGDCFDLPKGNSSKAFGIRSNAKYSYILYPMGADAWGNRGENSGVSIGCRIQRRRINFNRERRRIK